MAVSPSRVARLFPLLLLGAFSCTNPGATERETGSTTKIKSGTGAKASPKASPAATKSAEAEEASAAPESAAPVSPSPSPSPLPSAAAGVPSPSPSVSATPPGQLPSSQVFGTAPPATAADIVYATGAYQATLLAGGAVGRGRTGTGDAAVVGNNAPEHADLALEGTVSPAFMLYTDGGSNQIRGLDLATRAVSLVFGSSVGDPKVIELPAGLVYDATRSVYYLADHGNNRILRFNRTTKVSEVMVSTGLTAPSAMALAGNALYVLDGSNRVLTIDVAAATPAATAFAGGGASTPSSATDAFDRAATKLLGPSALAVSTDGKTLFIAEAQGQAVRSIDLTSPTSQVLTFAGRYNAGSKDGGMSTAVLNGPIALACDKTHLYVGEANNHRVRVVSLTDRSIQTVLGLLDGGKAVGDKAAASFTAVTGLACDLNADKSLKALYVYDGGSASVGGRLIKIQP